MFCIARLRVLAANLRTAQDGKAWLDLYALQDGRREPITAYADPAKLGGDLPKPGALIDAALLVYARREDGLSVRVDAFAEATDGTPVGSGLVGAVPAAARG